MSLIDKAKLAGRAEVVHATLCRDQIDHSLIALQEDGFAFVLGAAKEFKFGALLEELFLKWEDACTVRILPTPAGLTLQVFFGKDKVGVGG